MSALPLAVFAIHALVFGAWICDDAGISFAYARNLSSGHGLVAQPGAEPVEGYSNLLWILLLSPFFATGLFHVVITPKLVPAALVAASLIVVQRVLRRIGGVPDSIVPCAFLLAALQPAFVIWAVSGLENALYVFLTVVLAATILRACAPAAASAGGELPRRSRCLRGSLRPASE